MQKLKVGDTVQVMKGAERSATTKRGKVLFIDKDKGRVRVEGLRLVKRHTKKSAQSPEGGIIEKPGTIAAANLAVVCGKCDKPTRIGIRDENGERKRFCKNCEALID
jgi:large subunit ribosomal protein L24